MSPEALERRVAALEEEVRQLRRAMLIRLGGLSPEEARRAGAAAETAAERAAEEAGSGAASGPAAGSDAPAADVASSDRPGAHDLEQWFGQRGLLVVGLMALVVAAAFLLQYAFDRGWIAPGLRIGAGLLVGALLWWNGERLAARGMIRFGAALVGGGGALAYLALWAAAGPYHLLPPWTGVVLLGLVAMVVLLRAARLDEHLLAALAGAGAYVAPVLLPNSAASADLLVAYAALVAFGTGAVAAVRGWRAAFGVAVVGAYVLLGRFAAQEARPWLLALAFSGGGALAVLAARVRSWPVLRGMVVVASWALLVEEGMRVSGTGAAWGVYLLLPLLATPSWPEGLGRAAWSGRGAAGPRMGAEDHAGWPWLVAAGVGWALAARAAAPAGISAHPLLVLALPAAPFLVAGILYRRSVAVPVGLGILAWGVVAQFEGPTATAALAALALASALLLRPRALAGARWGSFGVAAIAGLRLLSSEAAAPFASGYGLRVLGDGWSVGLYLVLVVLALLAGPLAGAGEGGGRSFREAPRLLRAAGAPPAGYRAAAWGAVFFLGLAGGTVEVLRLFPPEGRELARQLTVSAFWLVCAGGLLGWGLWREERSVRLAGLAVSALALVKIGLYDLTSLEALYRVGSFLLLALIALAAAFAYHRRVERAREEDGSSPPAGGGGPE